ncbi:MAG: response regulator, partial [Rubrivivax sp.]|nr:response regulator [Rubrivivax sp.]
AVQRAAALAIPPTRDLRAEGQTLKVVVAEDHPVNSQYMAALLESLGHQAKFTANGEEAVQAVREHAFDIVLMDLHMPVLDGVGATRAIRALADRKAATVPIVALTADAFPETRDRCLVAGMNDFLTKPVSPQKLASSLRRLFGASAAAEPMLPARRPSGTEAMPLLGATPLIDRPAITMALQAMPRERLAAMIHAYLDQGPQTVQRLRAAVRDAQPLELRVNAHAARGAALNLGLSALAATAAALHEGAAHLPAHEIARLVQHFNDLLPLTRDAAVAQGLAAAA